MKTYITTVVLLILLAIPVSATAFAGTDCIRYAIHVDQDQKKEAATKTVYT